MEHPERRDRSRRHERDLAPGEQDAVFLIQSGIDRALDNRSDVDDTTARIIAIKLAPTMVSNLALFAGTGKIGPHTTNAALREEYLPIYLDPRTPDDVRGLIDWLAAYLIHRESGPDPVGLRIPGEPRLQNLLWPTTLGEETNRLDVRVRADQTAETIGQLPALLAPLIELHGDAFIAFLSLADVDASSEYLEDSFDTSYRGSFTDYREALRDVAELGEIEALVEQAQRDCTGGDFVSLDYDAFWDQIKDVFDIVEYGGQYHVFDR